MIMKKTLFLISSLALAVNASADSLWKDDISRGVTADKTARLVGDILNVRVQESNVAKRDAKTETSRASAADANISSFLEYKHKLNLSLSGSLKTNEFFQESNYCFAF